VTTAPLTEVRDNLKDVVDTVVSTGETFTITRHGKPVAVIVGYEDYEELLETLNVLSDDDALAAIAEGRTDLGV
jgi:prevent-host-death family protein